MGELLSWMSTFLYEVPPFALLLGLAVKSLRYCLCAVLMTFFRKSSSNGILSSALRAVMWVKEGGGKLAAK